MRTNGKPATSPLSLTHSWYIHIYIHKYISSALSTNTHSRLVYIYIVYSLAACTRLSVIHPHIYCPCQAHRNKLSRWVVKEEVMLLAAWKTIDVYIPMHFNLVKIHMQNISEEKYIYSWTSERACSLMVLWASVVPQVLSLTLYESEFSGFDSIMFSVVGDARRQRGAYGDFINLEDLSALVIFEFRSEFFLLKNRL